MKNDKTKAISKMIFVVAIMLTSVLVMMTAIAQPATAAGSGTDVPSHITEDTTWTVEASPYILPTIYDDRPIEVYSDTKPITLTIEAGVEIQGTTYPGCYARVSRLVIGKNAALKVLGTSDSPVVFTTGFADKEKGGWGGVVIEADARGSETIIEHAIFEYGGGQLYNPGCHGYHYDMLMIYGGSPQISKSIFKYSEGNGVYVGEGASPIIKDCKFHDNDGIDIVMDDTSGGEIKSCDFRANGNAISLQNSLPNMADNTFCNDQKITVPSDITKTGTLHCPGLLDNGNVAPYYLPTIYNDRPIEVYNDTKPITLTIEAGIEIQGTTYPGCYARVSRLVIGKNAALKVLGTEDNPVKFTSVNTDSPEKGDWGAVIIEADSRGSETIIEHAIFEYGGGQLHNPGCHDYHYDMLEIYGGAPQISNSIFRFSAASGLYAGEAADPTITDCTFTENKIGLRFNIISPLTISGNSIEGNSEYGAINDNKEIIIGMTENWWGDASGPLDDSDDPDDPTGLYNPDGKGDNVSDYIKYEPWLKGKPTPPPKTVSLAEAVDNTELTWFTGGDADWSGQTSTYYYDSDAAQSGAIAHNQYSWIQTMVSGPGTLSFYWKVSSEANADSLEFYIDCIKQDSISGDIDWEQKSYEISSGTHTLMWKYAKNGDTDFGSDCRWLDKVEFSGGPGPAPAPAPAPALPTKKPDLTAYELTWAPTDPTTSDSITITWNVKNQGDADAVGEFTTELYVDGDKKDTQPTNGLAAEESTSGSKDIGTLSAGDHTIKIVTDTTGTVDESDESNNEYSKTVTVTVTVTEAKKPDLTPYELTWKPTDPTTSDSITITWRVKNQGDADAVGKFQTRLYIDGEKISTWGRSADTLAVGKSAFASKDIGTLSAGEHTVKVVTEITEIIDESDESNNEYTKTLTVTEDTGYLWLSDFTNDKIYKMDPSGTVLASFDSPGSVPSDLAWDGTYLWNLDKADGKIYKLDTAGTVIVSINAPGYINPTYAGGGLAWDGTYLWCTDDGWGKGYSNKIFKLDTSGNVITSFDAPQDNSYSAGLAWDGTHLWYERDYTNAELDNEIYKLDTTGYVSDHFTAPGPGSSGLAWDGSYFWVADDKIYQLDATGKVLKSFSSPGPSPVGLAWA